MRKRLSEIAALLGLELRGEDCEISGLNTLEAAGADEVSFLANPKYVDKLASTQAAAVIVDASYADHVNVALVSKNPYFDFGRALALFARPQGSFEGISDRAFVHPDATIGEGCIIYPNVYVAPHACIGSGVQLFPGCYIGERAVIGDDCVLYPNVSIMADVRVGSDCILHAGVVLGADGFGFARTEHGIQKIPQIGTVIIGNDVEIGANTTIDRSVLGATRVGDGTKIDNLVMLGHNVEVGRDCIIVSQVGVSGSTKIGNNVTIAGQTGIAGHLNIGSNVVIGPQAGVPKDIPANQTVGGSPAVDKGTYMRTMSVMPKLPNMYKRLGKLEKEFATFMSSRTKA